MRKKLLYLCVVLMLLTLSGCQKEETTAVDDLQIELSPSGQTVVDLATKIYSEQQLEEIVACEGTIEELDALYPIECLRGIHDYRVSYLGETSIAVIYFDATGKWEMGRVYNLSCVRSDFEDITPGQTLSDVQEVSCMWNNI